MNIRILYSIFIGILFAALVGVGIDAFYPGPTMPEYPEVVRPVVQPGSDEQKEMEDAEIQRRETEYQKQWEAYQEQNKIYNRNVSMIAMGFAILALIISLWLLKHIDLISDGLLFGGLITLIYSIIRGFAAESSQYRFMVVAVSFIVAIVVGYLKFIKPAHGVKPRSKKVLVN